jgi:2-C-methyl-D-erythritol 4-phosphate cytidylyltransferase/2-C-methyl-D-erythritol 2,4-cyclodiphosphate synthase
MEASRIGAWAVVVASGAGRRMGAGIAKQFLALEGEPIIIHTLRALGRWPGLKGVVVTAPESELETMRELIAAPSSGAGPVLRVVAGGAQRSDSVRIGLEALKEAADADIVMIHDGVRPFAPVDKFDELIGAAYPDGALFVVPVADTVKRCSGDSVVGTEDRSALALAQTPQAFPYKFILDAHRWAHEAAVCVTDDSSLVEARGYSPRAVVGSRANFKVTTPEDLPLAQFMIAGAAKMRLGHGYDVHRLVDERPLILGGVEIIHELGLLGHSDADVLLHAIMDALLGAAGLGDIGRHFPDTEARWKGASSLDLLEVVGGLLHSDGFKVSSVDATLVAQRPKVASHVAQMVANVAQALGIAAQLVNIKATTTEGLGFEGREEGISAHAVAALSGGAR